MEDNRDEVYACYARGDRGSVEPIIAALRAQGVEVWDGDGAAYGGAHWVEIARMALARSRRMLVFLSAASVASPWAADEIRTFRSLTARDPGRSLILVRLDGEPAPPLLAGAHEVDARGLGAEEAARLIGAAIGAESSRGKASGALSEQAQVPLEAPKLPPGDILMDEVGDEEALPPPVTPTPPAPRPRRPPVPQDDAPPPEPAPAPRSQDWSPGSPPVGQPPFTPPPAPGERPSGGVESEKSAPAQPVALERVAFAAYYPKEIEPRKATPLLVYLALDEVGTLAKVAALASERLAGRLDQYRSGMADARMALRRGAKLRLVPTISGFRVNPQWMDVTWDEDAQQHEFSVRAETAPEGRAAEGAVRVYQGLTLRAEIPLSIFVARKAGAALTPDDFASAVARAYRKVFASYSHRDMPVVESCEAAAQALGDRYLRDVMTLQSGQVWNEQLKAMINQADVFQLFWSKNAARSPFVREEWEFALALQANRPGFIRPVYWSPIPYPIPGDLNPLHFEPLSLSALGWGAFRRWLYSLQAG